MSSFLEGGKTEGEEREGERESVGGANCVRCPGVDRLYCASRGGENAFFFFFCTLALIRGAGWLVLRSIRPDVPLAFTGFFSSFFSPQSATQGLSQSDLIQTDRELSAVVGGVVPALPPDRCLPPTRLHFLTSSSAVPGMVIRALRAAQRPFVCSRQMQQQ